MEQPFDPGSESTMPFMCPLCPKRGPDERAILQHLADKHGARGLKPRVVHDRLTRPEHPEVTR